MQHIGSQTYCMPPASTRDAAATPSFALIRKVPDHSLFALRRRQLGADLMFERLWETVTGNGWVMEQGVARARDDCSQLQRPAAESPRDVIKCEKGVASFETFDQTPNMAKWVLLEK